METAKKCFNMRFHLFLEFCRKGCNELFFSAGCGTVAVSSTDASAPSAIVVAAAAAFFTVALFYIRLITVHASF